MKRQSIILLDVVCPENFNEVTLDVRFFLSFLLKLHGFWQSLEELVWFSLPKFLSPQIYRYR